MHEWGDEWFEKNGSDLERAISFLATFCRRFGRFGGQAKEKYGTLRFYNHFHSMIHDLIWPGYAYNQYPYDWMWRADIWLYSHTKWSMPIRWLVNKYQHFIYRLAYWITAKRWPHLRVEIYVMADFQELLDKDFDFSQYWSKGE